MQSFPDTPPLVEATGLSGHVRIEELPTGGRLRFRLAPSGHLVFGTDRRTFEAAEAVPRPYRRAVRSIRDRLDRDAVLGAIEDPEGITFFGVATWYEGVDYDWTALPPFSGTDVWSDAKGRYLTPEAAAGAFERLGLPSLPTVEKERPRAHADLDRYTPPEPDFPVSAWADGPAAGVLVRDKTGSRGAAFRPGLAASVPDPDPDTGDLAAEYATAARIDRAVESLREGGRSPTVDAVRDRVVADVVREQYARLYADGDPVTAMDGFDSAVAERVQRRLTGSRG